MKDLSSTECLDIYKDNSLSLNTDLYQLTMAQGYWEDGREDTRAIFHLFYRDAPFDANYAISAGQQTAIEYLNNHFEFDEEDIYFLSGLKGNDEKPLFKDEFLSYLSDLEFDCDVDMAREGSVIFPNEPIVRVEGPIIQAQLVETALLNCINYQTLVATKASLIKEAANGKPVLEFGLRRAQGIDGGFSAARASYIGGADGTSNVLAAKHLGIPVKGTHAHSWVQSYDVEQDSFEAFAKSQPNNAVFLVDTYDTIEGVKKAVTVGEKMRENGHEMVGIRLDSGDLCELSKSARKILDKNGFEEAKVIASDGLDVKKIEKIENNGGQIDAYGVGTNLVTCKGDPSLGGVYKLAAVKDKGKEWKPKIKLSDTPEKTSIPGKLQVIRVYDKDSDEFKKDILINELDDGSYDCHINNIEDYRLAHDVLFPVFDNGSILCGNKSIGNKRFRALDQKSKIPEGDYEVVISERLKSLKEDLVKDLS